MKKDELVVTNPEDYASLSDKEESELVPMPSGAVFRLRRVDVQELALIGELPLSLVNQGVAAWRERGMVKKSDVDEVIEEEDLEEATNHLIFLRQTVVDNCLEPRIGYSDKGVVSLLDRNGKAVAKLKKADFMYAFQWITSQVGVKAGRLDTFLKGQARAAANPRSHRKKFRGAPFVSAETQ